MLLLLPNKTEMLHQKRKSVKVVGDIVRLFLSVFLSLSSLTHCASSITSHCWGKIDGFFRSPGMDPKTSTPKTGIKAGGCQAVSQGQFQLWSWWSTSPVPGLMTTFSLSHLGLSLPQGTNNKQLPNKKVILCQKKPPQNIYALANYLCSDQVVSHLMPDFSFPPRWRYQARTSQC